MCFSRGHSPRKEKNKKEKNKNQQRDLLRFAGLDRLIRTISSIRVGLFVAKQWK